MDFELVSMVNMIKAGKKREFDDYLQEKVILKQVLHDFLASVLVHQPDDVFAFARQYFEMVRDDPDISESQVNQ